MSATFCEQIKDIYRLKIPFDTVYTSVFLIKTVEKKILFDCATTADDVDTYIVPALGELGYFLSDVDMIVLSHSHEDHAGGRERILELAPRIEIVTDVRPLCKGVSTYPLPGHTADSIGVLDERTHTLLSGDGLQGAGVDKYRCYTKVPAKYLETLKRLEQDTRIENILFSHAYEPWNRDLAFGRQAVDFCLSECKKYVK